MRKFILTGIVSVLLAQASHSQQAVPGNRLPQIGQQPTSNQGSELLIKFDLDFPGGTPRELASAIEQASGKPLNVIVPTEYADVAIPPLKMRGVNIAEFFQALSLASRSQVAYVTGFSDRGQRNVQYLEVAYGFRTEGVPRDDSIWYFYYQKPKQFEEARTCRFWQLGPYLNDYKVEDITTAIQTGYKMLGETAPTINFHQDTRLLIAVGEANKLSLIDNVLRELPSTAAASAKKATNQPAPKP